MVLFASGDGGWNRGVIDMARALATDDALVVGMDINRCFRALERAPGKCSYPAADLEGLSQYVQTKLRFPRYIQPVLVGYSFGADVLPFLASRQPAALLDKVALVALLSPGRTASFEFHLSYWLGEDADRSEPLIRPELVKLKGRRILCLAGAGDKDSLCSDLPAQAGDVRSIRLAGGHHFGGAYRNLAELILRDEQAAR